MSEVTEGNILCWHNFLVLRYKSAKTYISYGFNLKTGTVKYNGPNFSTVFFVPQWDFSRRVKGNGPFNRNYHEVILTRKFREHSELYVFNYFGFCLATVFQCEFTSECDLVLPVIVLTDNMLLLCVCLVASYKFLLSQRKLMPTRDTSRIYNHLRQVKRY